MNGLSWSSPKSHKSRSDNLFVVALLAIKSFITFLQTKEFKVFGYYRIIAGVVIIILYFTTSALHNA
jgi:undecaprenyl-diphosphatase